MAQSDPGFLVDWVHKDGLSGAMVKMRKTFEGILLEQKTPIHFDVFILIYKPPPRKHCTGH